MSAEGIVGTLIAVLVVAWAMTPSDYRPTPTVQPRVSRDDLHTCAKIAARRLKEVVQ